MDDELQCGEFVAIPQDPSAKDGAIDRAVTNRTGKARPDFFDKLATAILHCPDLGVGIEQWNSGVDEHLRDRRLAHAD
jgi:hypothetical protein